MFKPNNRKAVKQDEILRWRMQGKANRNADLEFVLQLRFVTNHHMQKGVILIAEGCKIPEEIKFGPQMREDFSYYDGQPLWLEGRDMNINFEGDVYSLFRTDEILQDGGALYFHTWLPKEFGSGDIIHTDEQNQE